MIYGTPAPLLTLCPSTFSAASPECGRTLLSLLATLSAALPAVFASITVVVLAALLTATAQAQDATSTDGICGRTEQVRTALLAQIPGVDTCGAVTDAHLAAITGLLDLSETSLPSLQAGDFDGLTGLTKLYLSRTGLETLPAGVFSDLTSLKNLLLESNELVTLPPRVFEDLTVLYELRLHSNQLKALREDVFASLSNLRTLDLEFNELPTLPTGVFSGLRLIFLGLESNELRTLRAGMFTGLNVETLDLSHNDTSSVAPETFNDLSWLKHLDLGYNQLETLPTGVLDGLTNLLVLWLEENPGTDFTFTMSVERKPGTNNAVVTVPQGAPFDMTTTISASGGALPEGVTSVTVATGRTRSDEIAITPLDGATVSLGPAPSVPSNPLRGGAIRFRGLTTAVGPPVTFSTPTTTTAPEIMSQGPFEVTENQARVTRLTARDTDAGDEVTGWAIAGGADRSQFTVASDSGELSFREAPDYEVPTDVASSDPPSGAEDNEYIVVVRVTSGAGDRELTAEQPIRVRVTNENEPPRAPEATLFSGAGRDSLTVSWAEPENTGPPITDYDVQYRTGSDAYQEWPHTGQDRTATITGLNIDTAYQVQVRAGNDEGTGDWSEPGEGRTIAPLTVQMTPSTPPPVEAPFAMRFSFSEEVSGFTSDDIATQQEPPCTNSENNPVSCNPSFTALQTTDDRVFTTIVAPQTEGVAHNYTLTISVSANRVTSVVDNKPNEAATIAVRVGPPGVTVPISSIGLAANSGNGWVALGWNAPENTGGSAIIRYEYRVAESGGKFSAWMRVDPGERSATVPNLTNGREYVFEVRGVNALGYGPVETAMSTPIKSGPGPIGPGGPVDTITVADAPSNLVADGGDAAVTLTWDAPEADGGAAITDYQYGINGRGWTSIGSTLTTHTVTGLVNDTVYVFQVRAVNAVGRSQPSDPVEATPRMPVALDFAHFANGTGITSEMVLVNVAPRPLRPAIYFYDRGGHLIDPDSVVDLTGDLKVTEDGSLSALTEMEPLGALTISTHGRGELASGSVKVVSDGPLGGVLRFDLPGIGVAGVGASPPVQDAIFPARRQAGGIRTAAALHNLGAEAMGVNCRLMSGGVALEEAEIHHRARQGTVHRHRRRDGCCGAYLQHAFGGAGGPDGRRKQADDSGLCAFRQRDLDHRSGVRESVHRGERSRPHPLSYGHPSEPPRYLFLRHRGRARGRRIGGGPHGRSGGHRGRRSDGPNGDGAAGSATISTHGRGALVSGSVRVVSDGPIGGMLRFEHPALGVAGVGASPPVSDALFPVRRQAGGITTGVALHNLESSPGLLRCDLMREGVLLDAASIPLEANGQTAWLIDQAFPSADTSDFAGSVRCDAVGEGLFSAVALEMDPGNRIFTTLPVVPVEERMDRE